MINNLGIIRGMTNDKEQKHSIIHCRVSTNKQAQEGESLDVQEKVCNGISESRNAKVLETWKEPFTGRKDKRPAFEEVLKFIKTSPVKVDYYIFRGIDRFTRGGTYVYETMKRELLSLGVELIDSYGIIQPMKNTLEDLGVEYDWSTYSPSEISELVLAYQSKQEITTMLTRMIGQEIRLVRQGYTVGKPNDGYVNKKIYVEGKKKTIQVPDPDRAKYYIEMFNLRASCRYSDQEIVDKINAIGFKTKARNKWNNDNDKIIGKKGCIPLTIKQLQKSIKNPIYAGVKCGKWTNYLPLKTKYPGLVSIEMFNRANKGKVFIKEYNESSLEILYDYSPLRTIRKRIGNNPLFPFKNVILCPYCRKNFLGSSPRGKSGNRYPTYHCARDHKYFGVKKDDFEDDVNLFIKKLEFTPEWLNSIEYVLLDEYRKRQKEIIKASSKVNHHVGDLKEEQQGLISTLIGTQSPIARREIEKRIEDIENRIKQAKKQRLKLEISEHDIKSFIKKAKYVMEHLEELLINSKNMHAQQTLFGLVFEEFPTYFEILNGTPKLSLVFRLSKQSEESKSQMAGHQGLEWNTIEEMVLKWKYVFNMVNLAS